MPLCQKYRLLITGRFNKMNVKAIFFSHGLKPDLIIWFRTVKCYFHRSSSIIYADSFYILPLLADYIYYLQGQCDFILSIVYENKLLKKSFIEFFRLSQKLFIALEAAFFTASANSSSI